VTGSAGTRREYIHVGSRAASMPHTVPADPATHPGTNRVPRERKIKTKGNLRWLNSRGLSPLETGRGIRGWGCVLPVRDRPEPWMARASVQGCIHSVSRTGKTRPQPAPIPATHQEPIPQKTQGKTTPSARNISVKRINGSPIRLFGSSPINFSNSVMPSPSDLKLPAQFSGCSRST